MESFCRGTNYGSLTHCKGEHSSLLIKATWLIQYVSHWFIFYQCIHVIPQNINTSPTERTFSKEPIPWEISFKFLWFEHPTAKKFLHFYHAATKKFLRFPGLELKRPAISRKNNFFLQTQKEVLARALFLGCTVQRQYVLQLSILQFCSGSHSSITVFLDCSTILNISYFGLNPSQLLNFHEDINDHCNHTHNLIKKIKP